MESDAERALRREATLAAVAEAEGIEVSDEEMLEALQPGEEEETPEQLLERLRANGRDALLSEELRLRKAAELIAELGEADPAGAGRRPREAVDAREGEGARAAAKAGARGRPRGRGRWSPPGPLF